MFINIHSHHPGQPGDLTLQSLYREFERADTAGYYSLGLHPWFIRNETWESEWEMVQDKSRNQRVLAIGECGLDKVCSTDWHLQETVFKTQLSWANEIHKPVIIHCVRAYEETLRLIKETGMNTPCLFHGFNRGVTLAGTIIQAGHYISFGKAVVHGHAREALASIPEDRYFLETDDADLPISEIYKAAAEARNMNIESIILQCQKNMEKVFLINPEHLT